LKGLYWVPLGTSTHKEGVVEMVGEWSPQPGEKTNKKKHRARKKKDVASAALGRKGMVIHR
jgi:hypothetical protein